MRRWYPEQSTVVLTGASSGIGRELTKQLVAAGASVYAVARRESRLRELETELAGSRGKLLARPGDITDPAFRREFFQEIRHAHDRLDLLVNGAGVGAWGDFATANESRMRQVFEVNFFAAAEWTRAAIPLLVKSPAGVICNIGSVLGHTAVPQKSEYSAAKFALHGWSDALRAELAHTGIQVTLVSPSTTATEFFDVAIDAEAASKRFGFGTMSAERVAAATLRAIRARRREVILSPGGNALVWLDRLCPPLAAWILSRTSKRSDAMQAERDE